MKTAQITFEGRIPSLKNAKRIVRLHGRLRMLPSLAWTRFEKFVMSEFPKPEKPLPPPYEIHYMINMRGKGHQDFDNIIAGVNDLLQKLGHITDDRHIYKAVVEKFIEADDYITIVNIKPYGEEREQKKNAESIRKMLVFGTPKSRKCNTLQTKKPRRTHRPRVKNSKETT